MKGQLTIEYMISFLAFIGLVMFIYFQYESNIPNFIVEIDKEHTRSEVYQLSEILLNDAGQPSNWDFTTVERIGLLDENINKSNILSKGKIDLLDSKCSSGGYLEVQGLVMFNHPFSIRFYNITDTGERDVLLECPTPEVLVKKTELNTTVKRITAFYNNDGTINFGELIVEV